MKRHHLFATLLQNQKSGYELVMTSVLITVGVNLLSTGIVELLGFQYKEIILIIMGITISLGVIARITWVKLKNLNQTTKFEGFIIYDEDNRKIIGVPEYEISTDMVRYLGSAFSENKALEKMWNRESISQFKIVGGKPGEKVIGIATHSGALFVELLEYCLIEKLSLHLSSYFNNNYEKPKTQEFQKNDIPQVLLSNRFLKLFSEDMINREIFACQGGQSEENKDNSRIVCAQNSSGGYYHRFDLILPEKSKVTRRNKNEIIIETPILTLTLTSLFGGFSTVLRSGFTKYYLGLTNAQRRSFHEYQFNVEVSIRFKLKSLFLKDNKVYYSWIDSFLDEIGEYIGQDEFFERINWDTVYTTIRCTNNISTANESAPKS